MLRKGGLYSEDDWLLLFRQGHETVFRQLCSDYRVRLIYFVTRWGLSTEEAEDVVAGSFVKLWQSRADFSSETHIRNFLYLVTRHAVLNQLDFRAREKNHLEKYRSQQPAAQEPFSHERVEAEVLHRIRSGIDQLPPECRKVIELYLKECSTGQIADELSISPATVRSQKRRAIQLLKDWLQRSAGFIFVILSLCLHTWLSSFVYTW